MGKAKAAGFTLLEILVALAILAILMIGLIKITNNNIQNLWHVENKTIAAIVAANHATELRLGKDKPEYDKGVETQAGRRWYWEAKRPVTTTLGLWHYQISVYLEGGKEPYATLVTLVPEVYDEKAAEAPTEEPEQEADIPEEQAEPPNIPAAPDAPEPNDQ